GIWFEEVAIDSFLYGGGTYYHNLYFNLTSDELKKFELSKYRIMVKRVWKNDFEYIYGNTKNEFELLAKPPDKQNGKFTFDFGVLSVETGQLLRIYTHVSQW